ncbi:MAG: phosphoribosylaminoimidazolesuccinocarboxamide synthase [Rhodospirillaceae bacterium TMED167]|nr:phosphoribosylaminoimidazolesuccinocarboxamide synthase [Rhodospirillaceae bacterium]OUW23385.1 MAG: phosphoribosylaminoimidazolesuccinocarboxamide synthase [Rhodospirillaceae bacterium TMED167]
MQRRTQLYEGKAKVIFEGPEPGTVVAYFKDDSADLNGEKPSEITGKGVVNNAISDLIMTRVAEIGVPTHLIKRLNMREQLLHKVEIIPIKVVVRNVVAGSLAKRFGMEEGTPLPRSIVEFYYKNHDLGCPMILEEHITAFGWVSHPELDEIMSLALRTNDFLSGLFSGIGIKLVNFKMEFGRYWEDEQLRILLSDEITPDSCRLWDLDTNKKLEKDRFRQDRDGIEEAYQEIAARLGVLPDLEHLSAEGLRLVQ